ncbi:MAG: L-type lectin-domain containing protein [Bacteroidota bacterium]
MDKFLSLLFLVIFSLNTNNVAAQLNIRDFELGGSATKLNEQCIRLVPDLQYDSGSAWYKKAIDLNAPFEMEVCLVLGCKDEEGADGIVFVFTPFARTGFWGEGMGFAGLNPSLGIEFDTYQNYHLGDPAEDHIAIMGNGETHHAISLVKPVLLPNLENCERHPLQITWNPETQLLEIYLDYELQASYNRDLVNDIFRGNSGVYWGITSATGRLSNNHDICIKKLQFAAADGMPTLDFQQPKELLAEEKEKEK